MSWIGQKLPRFEDARLLTGQGRYTDDQAAPGAAVAVFVRSPHAHARIRQIDTAAARAMPGVCAVLDGAQYRADGHGPIHHVPVPAAAVDPMQPAFGGPGAVVHDTLMWPLAQDVARFVGEPVAMVVADSLAAARDAAEQVVVEYEILPAAVTREAALAAAPIWPGIAGNICLDQQFGDPAAVAVALAGAHLVLRREFTHQRIVNAQMEPRSVLGAHDAETGITTLVCGSQGVVRQRLVLAGALGVPPERVRVVTHDVGGGFGPRSFLESEALLVCWAARRLGRKLRWRADRSECFLADFQARDLCTRAAIGFDEAGRILGLDIALWGNVGAHTVALVPLANGSRLVSTVYHVPVAAVRAVGVLTNTPATVAFRGAGRPEATYVMERLLDLAAPLLGMDRITLRRANLVARTAMPYRNAMGLTYDSGAFAANMEQALALADWDGFAARRAGSVARGQRRGIGIGNYVESPVGAPKERVQLRVLAGGVVELLAGTQSTGQGHQTSFAQVVADQLGVSPHCVRLVTGDTDRITLGGGSHSARSMRLGGLLMVQAAEAIVAQARDILGGANQLDVFAAAAAAPAAVLEATAELNGRVPAFPTGCAVCELEIDPETGAVRLLRYCSVDDVGQAINPLIVEGQTHGGIVQGIGQALCEGFAWDETSGQVLSGSLMDYALPRADMLPALDVVLSEDPTLGNPLRVKGGGEGGIVPAPAAVIGAIADALRDDGVDDIPMPASAERIWRQLQDARTTRAANKGG